MKKRTKFDWILHLCFFGFLLIFLMQAVQSGEWIPSHDKPIWNLIGFSCWSIALLHQLNEIKFQEKRRKL